MNGQGLLLIILFFWGALVLALYGVPAFSLLLTQRTNRSAAKFALGWSIFPAGLFLYLRIADREDIAHLLGDGGRFLVLLLLLPTALIDWWAWSRLSAEVEPEPAVAHAPVTAIPRLIPLWIAIYLFHSLFTALGFLALRAGGSNTAIIVRAMLVASGLGWLALGIPQWLVLKKVGVRKSWIGATFAAGIGSNLLMQIVVGRLAASFGRDWVFIVAVIPNAIAVAAAQWACIPPRFVRRGLWLLALPAVELAVSLLTGLVDRSLPFGTWEMQLSRAVGALLVGLGSGLAMQKILASGVSTPNAQSPTPLA